MIWWLITGASGCNGFTNDSRSIKVYVFSVRQHIATMLCLTFDLDLGYQNHVNKSPKIAY